MGIPCKLEFWSTLESKSFRLSRSKMEYMECPFSHNRNKNDSEVIIENLVVLKSDCYGTLGFLKWT